MRLTVDAVSYERASVPFLVKALKVLLHKLQSNGKAASIAALADIC